MFIIADMLIHAHRRVHVHISLQMTIRENSAKLQVVLNGFISIEICFINAGNDINHHTDMQSQVTP